MSRRRLGFNTAITFALGFIAGASLATLGARELASMNQVGLTPADLRNFPVRSDRRVEIPGREALPKRGASTIDVEAEDLKACRNGVVQTTISTRGQLNQTKIYIPRHAIHRFVAAGSRGYPLSITIKPDCLTLEMTETCRISDKLFGFSAGLKDTPVRREARLSGSQYEMIQIDSDIDGLRAYKFSEEKVRERLNKGEVAQGYYDSMVRNISRDQAFVNFSSSVNSETTPTMYVYCRYRTIQNDRPCTWSVGGPWKLIALQSTSREALADWRPFFNRSVALMKAVSVEGEFYDEC